jgi:hypothetical protein
MGLWSVLSKVYKGFRESIKKKGRGYEGMIYREVAEMIDKEKPVNLEFETYILVGFNALNPCEERLFDFLKGSGNALFFWDYDSYYTDNMNHEAGHFIRRNLARYPEEKIDLSFSELEKPGKQIDYIAAPTEMGQTKIISQLVKQVKPPDKQQPHQTAIVLADEKLLMPVLYSIPSDYGMINVTMGYPIKDSPLYSLVVNLIELQKGKRYKADKIPLFYHKPVLALLNHQYLHDHNDNYLKDISTDIIQNNRIYIDPSTFVEKELTGMIFKEIRSPGEMSEYLLDILLFLYNKLKSNEEEAKERTDIHQEYVYHLYLTIKRLGNIISDEEIKISFNTYLKLLDKLVKNIRIPFSGEPLAGLQVMGILETRALDFENLIMISMNEGIFPGGRAAPTFIPYNLRKGFGLPTIEHQDAIYAYYFYRLLQRAKNVKLIYNSDSQGMRSGEMSRYLIQLNFRQGFAINKKNIRTDIQLTDPYQICIDKDERIMKEILGKWGPENKKSFLSPSALNCYLDCSLKFYFRYIAGLKEPDELSEEIDYPVFGTLLHRAINLLYSPLINKVVEKETLSAILREPGKIENAITQAFSEIFRSASSQSGRTNPEGRNLVILEILKKYLTRILKVDMQYLPFEFLFLEKVLDRVIYIENQEKELALSIGGTIDRVDRTHNEVRIIDYKTGRGDLGFQGISSLFNRGNPNRNGSVFQTLLYASLVSQEMSDQTIVPGLYYARDLFKDEFDYHIINKDPDKGPFVIHDFKSLTDEFTVHIADLLKEIVNPETPFQQVENSKICEFCPYKEICQR